MIYYPPDELKALRKLLKLRGVQEQILNHTGIAKSTVTRIAQRGMGTHIKVEQLRRFVYDFNEWQRAKLVSGKAAFSPN